MKEENTLIEDSLESLKRQREWREARLWDSIGHSMRTTQKQCSQNVPGSPTSVLTCGTQLWQPGQRGSKGEVLQGPQTMSAHRAQSTRAPSLEAFRLSSVTYCPCGGMQTLDREYGAAESSEVSLACLC